MTHHRPKYSLLVLLFTSVFLLLGFSNCKRPSSDGQAPLIVGMELSYPPFETRSPEGAPTGVSVDLALALGKALGRKVEIRPVPFDGLIPSLKTGKIDLIISSLTATDERRKSIAFSKPYLTTGLCLLVSHDSPIQSVDALNSADSTVAVKKGTTGHVYAREHLANAKLRVLDKETSAVLEVVQGKVDAFIYDQMSTYRNWKARETQTKALLDPFVTEVWAIGMRLGDEELKSQVDAFITEFRTNGGFDLLGDKYLAEEKATFEQLGYPFLF